jgi:hypothetical protein
MGELRYGEQSKGMAMKCPTCGAELAPASSMCHSCGQRFGTKLVATAEEAEPVAKQYRCPPQGSTEKPGRSVSPWLKLLITAIVLCLLVLLPLANNLGLFEPKTPEPEPEARINGWLFLDAGEDLFGGEGGYMYIHGDLHNYGEIAGSGTVNMDVFDGYEWRTYHKDTGVVPAGGEVHFEYSIHCDRIIVNDVEFKFTVTIT